MDMGLGNISYSPGVRCFIYTRPFCYDSDRNSELLILGIGLNLGFDGIFVLVGWDGMGWVSLEREYGSWWGVGGWLLIGHKG